MLAIPPKRFERAVVTFLTDEEVAALLAAPDQTRWLGRRDNALLLTRDPDRTSGIGAHRAHPSRRRAWVEVPMCAVSARVARSEQRRSPATTAAVLRAWLDERGGEPADPLFPTRQGAPLSRYAVTLLVSRHAKVASGRCPSIATKNVTPHVLRHTAAMRLLHAGVDTSVIALWLGHESSETTEHVRARRHVAERAGIGANSADRHHARSLSTA